MIAESQDASRIIVNDKREPVGTATATKGSDLKRESRF
jgi:hypothetical protein